MIKGLGILAGGIFIGAVGAELIHKACPQGLEGLDSLYAKVARLTNAAKEAFLEGYEGTLVEPEAGTTET